MKLPAALLLLLFYVFNANAQTVLFSEDFNGASPAFQTTTPDVNSTTTGNNKWIINNVFNGGTINGTCLGFTLPIPIPVTPSQPPGITGGPQSTYMHVTTDLGINDGVVNCHYLAADALCNPNPENIFSRMTTDFSTVGFSDITLSFWWLCAPDKAIGEVYFSTNGGTTWKKVDVLPTFSNKEQWTSLSIVVPDFLNQPTLRLGFRFINPISSSGKDPAFAVDDIKVTGTTSTPNTIITGAVLAGPYCPGDQILIPYAVTGTFNAGNIFTAQLSSPAGTFDTPVSLGTTAGTGNGVITGTIPVGTASGTYLVRVISNSPAVQGTPGSVNITVNAPPTATILPSSTASVCNGGTATLNASGGGTYQWLSSSTGSGFTPISGATSASYTSNPLNSAMYYQVQVSNACGNTTSATWEVKLQNVVDIPLKYEPASLNLCVGPVTVSVVGSFTNLTWSNGSTGNSVTLNAPETISVNGTAQNNCPAKSADVIVKKTDPLPLTVSPVSPVTLCGGSVNLTASPGFTGYEWSGGATTTGNPLVVTATGKYTVRATDANGCPSVSNEVEVQQGDTASIEITPANPAICPGQSAVLTASEGFTGYVWSNGATGNSISVNQSGTYSVKASPLTGGCPGESAPVTVTKSNFPIANFNYDQQNGLKIQFDNTSQNGIDYIWSFSTFGTSTAEAPTFTFTDSGPYYIKLIATNGCGSDTITKLVVVTDVGFEAWLVENGFRVFPNPSPGDFIMSSRNGFGHQLRFELLDLSGRSLGNNFTVTGASETMILPASQLNPGLYLLRVQSADGRTAVIRLIRT
jgi:PKD repeat protein